MPPLNFDPELCATCESVDCLVRCQYLGFDLTAAQQERRRFLAGEKTRLPTDCVTCYACEEYCPYGNHPFYHLVDRQEALGILPVPAPLTKQQIIMMQPRGRLTAAPVQKPVINMCYFPMLLGSIQGPLFEGASTIVGSDIFCNIMWLHFGRNSVIRERLPRVIENIWHLYLKDSGVDEIVCYHDECYGTYTQLAPAFNIDVPFRSVHLFQYLTERLTALKDRIRPLGVKVAYQRPCSNRLVPETQHWVDDIFQLIGAERVEREHDRDRALCCGQVIRAQQKDDLADEVVKKNLDDMVRVGARYCVFNCPACYFGLADEVQHRGLTPILMSDLCRLALP